MSEAELVCAVVWADVDILSLEVRIRFQGWAGHECAYASRGELTAFADALDHVANGGTAAVLEVGQANMSYVALRLFEYEKARRLGIDVTLGRAAGGISNRPSYAAELRMSVPTERGFLPQFANGLRGLVRREEGECRLALPEDWPW